MTQLATLDDIVEATQLPKSWWYRKTRETGPESVPRIKCGKYLRFEIDKVMEWLKDNSE